MSTCPPPFPSPLENPKYSTFLMVYLKKSSTHTRATLCKWLILFVRLSSNPNKNVTSAQSTMEGGNDPFTLNTFYEIRATRKAQNHERFVLGSGLHSYVISNVAKPRHNPLANPSRRKETGKKNKFSPSLFMPSFHQKCFVRLKCAKFIFGQAGDRG